MPRQPTVLIGDDYTPFIGRIRRVLASSFDVIAEVGDGLSLIEAAQRLRPDVIVTDINMPGLDGLSALHCIRQIESAPAVVVLTVHQESSFVEKAFDLGAKGYVFKTSAERDLVPAIQSALRGEPYLSSAIGGYPNPIKRFTAS